MLLLRKILWNTRTCLQFKKNQLFSHNCSNFWKSKWLLKHSKLDGSGEIQIQIVRRTLLLQADNINLFVSIRYIMHRMHQPVICCRRQIMVDILHVKNVSVACNGWLLAIHLDNWNCTAMDYSIIKNDILSPGSSLFRECFRCSWNTKPRCRRLFICLSTNLWILFEEHM